MLRELARHVFPRMTLSDNLRIRYTLCLGGLAFTCLMVLAGTGLLLLFYYSPSPGGAHVSIQFLESSGVSCFSSAFSRRTPATCSRWTSSVTEPR